MPLRDHFEPPLAVTHPWKGFHSAWANAMTNQLNDVLPEGYYAIPEVPLADEVEIDVATLEEADGNGRGSGPATAVWAPPRPRLTAPVDFSRVRSVAVHVFQDSGGPQLRAAVELVSPANKDRPRSRLVFAAKCVGYLERHVAVVAIDTVTTRQANMHTAIAQALDADEALAWASRSRLYAVAYRRALIRGQSRVEAWPKRLTIGAALPTLPLWIDADIALPLPLDASYDAACHSLRIGR